MARRNKPRYELKQKLGEGGMAVVWRAYDTVLNADVALKMLLDVHDATALKLFSEECKRQASLVHPNVIEIRDVGSFEENGIRQPYLVMPLLHGKTLADLIRDSRGSLSVERCVDIFTQACRGLQAAHDHGLIHRDIKPTNIFILDDDSVKIIDFGIAQRAELTRTGGRKGTLLYMSPEQLLVKPLTRASDIFSLGVVCYEVLTGEQPFAGASEGEIAEAIQHYNPPAASSLNGCVSTTLSQVLHKAMAKLSAFRYSTAKEFGDTLRRAFYDPAFCVFDPAQFASRLSKASEAFLAGDLNLAQDLVNELESEGYLDANLQNLSSDVKNAVQKKDVDQLLDTAKARMQNGEYRLALQRIHQALQLDDRRPEALALQIEIKAQRDEADIREWLEVGRQRLAKFSFAHAKQAASCILENYPEEERARQLLSQIERKSEEYHELCEQKEQAYTAALEAQRQNDLLSALSKMKQVMELDKQAPDLKDPGRSAEFQNLYNKFRAEHESLEERYREAKQAFDHGEYDVVSRICDDLLETYPQHTLFKALKFDNHQRWRRAIASLILEVEERAEQEPDLDRRVSMLEQMVCQHPDTAEFRNLLGAARHKQELVNGIAMRAREFAEDDELSEALVQWETLKTIHPHYPGLDSEIDALRQKCASYERAALKKRWLNQINSEKEEGRLEDAFRFVYLALEDFPQDSELIEIEKDIRLQKWIVAETERFIVEGRSSLRAGNVAEGLEQLRGACKIGSHSVAKIALVEGLLAAAKASGGDGEQALSYLREVIALDGRNQAALDMLRSLEKHDRHTEDEILDGDSRLLPLQAQTGTSSPETSISSATEFETAIDTKQPESTRRHNKRWLRPAWLTALFLVAVSAAAWRIIAKREGTPTHKRSQSNGSPVLVMPKPTLKGDEKQPVPALVPVSVSSSPAADSVSASEELQVIGVGSVSIDGSHFFPLRDAAFSLTLPDGDHRLQWIGDSGRTESLNFVAQKNRPATIDQQPASKNTALAMVVSTSGSIATVYSNVPAALQIDGGIKGRATTKGIQFSLENGYHEFRILSPVQSRVAGVEIGSGRKLTVSFRSDVDYGTLAVESNQPDFQLKLAHAGKEYRSMHVISKAIAFDHLPPGQYVLYASKDGFGAAKGVPVAVKKLQKARVVLDLEPWSSFLVHSLPGADILVDGKPAGVTDANGNLALKNLACARHMVEARRHDQRLAKEVQLIGDKLPDQVDLPLKPGPGTIVLTLSPPSSTVSVSQIDGKVLPLSGSQFELPGGQYRITVRAPNFQECTQIVDVAPERVNQFSFSLAEQRPAFQPPQTLTANLEGWNKQEWDFNKKNSAMSHRKAGIALFDSQHSQGSYVFTISREKFPMLGRRAMQWVAGYLDPDNYLLFSISRAGFESCLVQSGQATQHKASSQIPELDQYTIAMIVQSKQIDIFLYEDGKWVRIEQWSSVQQDLDRGKFGFKDRVIVRNFRFDNTHPLLTAEIPH